MAAEKDALLFIQFAKSPRPGRVKTRMMPTLSAGQACELHRELLLWTCRALCSARLGAVELWVAGDMDDPVFRQCREYGLDGIRQQDGGDLGERMCHAMADGLARYERVVLVGSDCPGIDGDYLSAAHRALATHSVVLGPADDGGYVLVGADGLWPELFTGMQWGHSSVFADTVASLNALDVPWEALVSLPDIDRPEDLPTWERLNNAAAKAP